MLLLFFRFLVPGHAEDFLVTFFVFYLVTLAYLPILHIVGGKKLYHSQSESKLCTSLVFNERSSIRLNSSQSCLQYRTISTKVWRAREGPAVQYGQG